MVLRHRSDTRDELGFGDEMVLMNMFMDIDPLSMRGLLVMTMASISPFVGGVGGGFPGRIAPSKL